ncbi:MAG TPA: chemotaxis response regulator protein-glutamate methylesterase [Burkholderiales bacterium]|nr:chemotaxis response regulator protein-glutamate methylesterase [Burkholderiales bacterium]
MAAIRVLIVDDSALVRALLTEIVRAQPDMEIVGAARDPYAARALIREMNPDVITLDVEMPRMNGLEFLARLMQLRPTPVLMISSLTERGAEVTMRALELGAVDFVAKPRLGIAGGLEAATEEIVSKIRVAARARVRRSPASAVAPAPLPAAGFSGTEKLVFIGASTGGTEAIKDLLVSFPPDYPGTLITLHMPPGFTQRYAERLDRSCRITVREARDGEPVLPGHAYVAPGDHHLRVARSGSDYLVRVSQDEPVNRHRPSVDVLFSSAARHAGPNGIGVLLTGMGKDGARAMLEMRQAGAWTIAQDEASCIVFGMPREAIALGAAQEVLPLDRIAGSIAERLAAAGPRGVRV